MSRSTTMPSGVEAGRKFVPAVLPWLVAALALGIYLFTLNTWVSLQSLPETAVISGWIWQAQIHGPVYWLVTSPFRLLPPNAIPVAMNLFSTVCAVLTLALLARSVALLPHDRTHDQRERERSEFSLLSIPASWLPPVLACLVCGLQLSFWEHATAASREIFDLLLFAYIIRCLLEFRIHKQQSWLTRAAFVYGAAMTNNWAMIGFFPLFITALIWIKGLSFFNTRFLGPMLFWGSVGLLFYLVLPWIQSRSYLGIVGFWPALKGNLVLQKNVLLGLVKNYRQVIALLSLTSVVPIFVISIRWASYFGDTSHLGQAIATLMFHFVHALFLVACIWIALDPPVSPRNKGGTIAFLTFYYLGALTVGYCSGYLLLVFSPKPSPQRTPGILLLAKRIITVAVWLILPLTPLILIARNLPLIRVTNGPLLRQLTSLVAQKLPPRAVLLSDDLRRTYLLESALTQAGRANDYIFLDSASMPVAAYQRYLKRRYSQNWPLNPPRERKTDYDTKQLIELVSGLAQSNRVFYLHPSFGYYFEFFYPEPHGMVYELRPYPAGVVMAPARTPAQLDENEAFWMGADNPTLGRLAATIAPPGRPANPGLMDLFVTKAHLTKEANRDAGTAAWLCSSPLVAWGVELQKAGQFVKARAQFLRALDMNPDNVVAQINLRCNTNLQDGLKISSHLPRSIEDAFGAYRNWDQVLAENGPFDDPNFCYEQGRVYVGGSLYRQAFHQFARVTTLDPDRLDARLWLAQLYVMSHRPDDALDVVQYIHAHAKALGLTPTNLVPLLFVETSAQLAKTNAAAAQAAVQAALEAHPADEDVLATAAQVYMDNGISGPVAGRTACFSNALTIIEQQLKLAPDNLNALVNEGFVCLQINASTQGLAACSRVLELQSNNPSALFNRAIFHLRLGQLDESQRDYETLQKAAPNSFAIFFGLQEIAYRKGDTNTAIRNCQLYLANAPTNTTEASFIAGRLKELSPRAR